MPPLPPTPHRSDLPAIALHRFDAGGFAYAEGNFRYAQGIVALPGFRLRRVRFAKALPMVAGFAAIAERLAAAGRPRTALAACELRCSRPYGLDGFDAFNRVYGGTLRAWGLEDGGRNPVARSNVAPEAGAPSEQCIHAFTFTVPAADPGGRPDGGRDFVVAGSGEWLESTPFPDGIIARGDTGPKGLERKARWVVGMMRHRVAALGADWDAVATVQVYTVHDLAPIVSDVFVPAGLTAPDLVWQYCRPPVTELEFEMDLRRVSEELVTE